MSGQDGPCYGGRGSTRLGLQPKGPSGCFLLGKDPPIAPTAGPWQSLAALSSPAAHLAGMAAAGSVGPGGGMGNDSEWAQMGPNGVKCRCRWHRIPIVLLYDPIYPDTRILHTPTSQSMPRAPCPLLPPPSSCQSVILSMRDPGRRAPSPLPPLHHSPQSLHGRPSSPASRCSSIPKRQQIPCEKWAKG